MPGTMMTRLQQSFPNHKELDSTPPCLVNHAGWVHSPGVLHLTSSQGMRTWLASHMGRQNILTCLYLL